MRNTYLNELYQLAEKDKRVLALLADNGVIVFDKFIEKFPKQYLNYGISECEMIASAAGLAACGKIPFVYTMATFLAYRGFEFIRDMVCLQNLNVKIIGTGAGVAYSGLGPTHHATEDLAILRAIPNLIIFSPGSPEDVKNAIHASYEIEGPVYIRLAHNKESEIYHGKHKFQAGKGIILHDGKEMTLVGTGSIMCEVQKAAERLQNEGISVHVINIHTIKPFDRAIIIKAAQETNAIITVEEHNIIGGLGSAVAEVIAEENLQVKFKRVGLPDTFAKGYGTHTEVKEMNGLGTQDIYEACKAMF